MEQAIPKCYLFKSDSLCAFWISSFVAQQTHDRLFNIDSDSEKKSNQWANIRALSSLEAENVGSGLLLRLCHCG